MGLAFGSFATVAAHRTPKRETWGGRSKCPTCGETITASENIPVLSWLIQRGRCRHCKAKISVRYPLIELVTGLAFGLAAWRFGVSVELVAYSGFFWTLVVLSVIDLEYRLLPNLIVYPLFVAGWALLGAAALISGEGERLYDAALGMLIFGGFFFLIAFLFPAGMGGGDVKLSFVLGTFLGYDRGAGVVIVGMFLSFLLGGLVGVAIMSVQRSGRKTMVPFGPFLAVGTVIALFWGGPLLDAYLDTL